MSETRCVVALAGDNKFKLMLCPMCGKGPSEEVHTKGNFMFRDGRSAEEYRISALCQDCQDDTFVSKESK